MKYERSAAGNMLYLGKLFDTRLVNTNTTSLKKIIINNKNNKTDSGLECNKWIIDGYKWQMDTEIDR